MLLDLLLLKLNSAPEAIEFSETMAAIDELYDFSPVAFQNGELMNEAGKNTGSCKILAFGRRHQLSEAQVLACFGAFYRDDVLKHPQGMDHQNIRNFMKTGWSGVEFFGEPLIPKN